MGSCIRVWREIGCCLNHKWNDISSTCRFKLQQTIVHFVAFMWARSCGVHLRFGEISDCTQLELLVYNALWTEFAMLIDDSLQCAL